MQKLGERIRQVRGRMSQEAFAALLGISKGALGGYERGENCPNVEVVLAICRICHVEIGWLLTGEQSAEGPSGGTPARTGVQGGGFAPAASCTDENMYRLEQNFAEPSVRKAAPSGQESGKKERFSVHAAGGAERGRAVSSRLAAGAENAGQQCGYCTWLQEQFMRLEEERRDLNRENRILWQKNADLSVRLARLEQAVEKRPDREAMPISPGYVSGRRGLHEEPQSSGGRRLFFRD